MAAKVRALQEWCRRQCEGYRDVAITNLTTSWKSGLAFCAIIHRYRPDLIDYDRLSKEDVYENNKLAFDVAHDQLGIPALLDPEDMVMMAVPDKLCIVTYVAQYYNYFHNKPQVGGPGVRTATKRASRDDVVTEAHPASALQPPTVKKSTPSGAMEHLVQHVQHVTDKKENDTVSTGTRGGTLDDRCQMCRGRVYLLERHYTPAGRLYHRHCYRGFQRTATLTKSRQSSAKENTDKPSSNGNILGSGKTGLGGSPKDTNCVQSSGSGAARESRLASSGTQGGRDTAYVTAVSSHKPTTSSLSTGLIKALYSTPNYKHITSTVESVTPPVSHVNVGRLKATSASSSTTTTPSSSSSSSSLSTSISSTSIPVSSALRRSGVLNVTAGRTVLTPSSAQSVFAAAKSQYLQRADGLNTHAVTSSTATVSMPSYGAGRTVRNVTSAASATMEASSSAVLSRILQPLVSSVAAGPSRTTDKLIVTTPETTTSYRTFTNSSSGNAGTKPSVTAACVANTKVCLSSGISNFPSTTVGTTSSATSSYYGYISPFRKDRMLTAAVTTTCVRSVPVTSSYTSAMKSPPATSPQRPVTAVTASRTLGLPFRSSHLSPEPHHLAKNTVDSSENDSAMVNSILQKFAEARESKQQSRRVSSSAVQCLPVQSVGTSYSANVAPVTLSTGNSRTTANSRAGTVTPNKTEWQLEVERRQAARKGVYVDPEKKQKEAVQQLIGRKQLSVSDLRDSSSYVVTLSKTLPSTVASQSNMYSSANNTVTTAAFGMHLLRPTVTAGAGRGHVSDVSLSPLRAAYVSDVSSSHLHAARSPRNSKLSQSEVIFQQQDLFLSKKSDSSQPLMTVDQITRHLEELDTALRVVESEGRDLEEKIRKDTDDAMDDDKDSRMARWFALIKRRHELIREESDLLYRRREQELEELHEELEYQLRPLLEKSDEQKTMKEKQDEERLLHELLEVVSLRNNIVDSIEVDRLRYIEEDQKIEDLIVESGLSTSKSAKKNRKKKAHVLAKKDSKSPDKRKSKKKLFHFTSRQSLSLPFTAYRKSE